MFIKKTVLVIIVSLLFMACSSKDSKDTSNKATVATDNGTEEVQAEVPSETADAKSSVKTVAALREMTPTTDAEFEQWLPESILGLPHERTEAYANNASSASGFTAIYGSGDKEIKYRLLDMAGHQADQLPLSQRTIGKERLNQKNSLFYKKAVQKEGYVATEIYTFAENHSSLAFIHNNRFKVDIAAKGFKPDEVWSNLGDLKLDELN